MADPDPTYVQARNDAITAAAGGDLVAMAAAIETAHQRYLALGRGGVTAGALPFPSPLDPLFEIADAVRALAEGIPRIAIGTATISTNVAAGGYGDVSITFPAGRFTGTSPRVFATPSGYRFAMSVYGLSSTGATLRVANWSGTATSPGTIYWVAFADPPAIPVTAAGDAWPPLDDPAMSADTSADDGEEAAT